MDYVGTHICVDNVKTKNFEKRKSHITFGTAEATKLVFGMFLLIALDTNITIPKYQKNQTQPIPRKLWIGFTK